MSNSDIQLADRDWECAVFFDDTHVENAKSIEVPDENVVKYFSTVAGTGDQIKQAWIYKTNLNSRRPSWFGLWDSTTVNEFTVLESTDYYWSFEKNSEGIFVQRSWNLGPVKDYLKREQRTGTVEPEGRDPGRGKEGDTVQHIFEWIYEYDYRNRVYHITNSNCHNFASLVFDAITYRGGQKLRESADWIDEPNNQLPLK